MMEEKLVDFLALSGFFLGIFGFSMVLYSVILRFAHTLGIRDKDTVTRWDKASKPALGGIIFYIAFLLSIVYRYIIYGDQASLSSIAYLGSLGAVSLAFIMGLADDAYNTRPLLKFGVQLLCGVLLLNTGTMISLSEYYWVNVVLTIIWVIGIMNSINMLDNMDGITSITSIFIFLAAMVFMALHGLHSQTDFLIMLGAVSTLVAFLFFNWNPSKMYMGDTGSQFLGIVLAIVGIRYFWNSRLLDGDTSQWQQIFAVVLAFMLPIIDTSVVTINRLSRGQSPFIGGKDHTTHNLSYLGLSDSQVAMTFALISLINLFILYFLFRFVEEWTLSLGIGLAVYVLIFFAVALIMTRRLKHHYIQENE